MPRLTLTDSEAAWLAPLLAAKRHEAELQTAYKRGWNAAIAEALTMSEESAQPVTEVLKGLVR